MLRSFSKVMFTSKKLISSAKLYNFETMSRIQHRTTYKTKPHVLGGGESCQVSRTRTEYNKPHKPHKIDTRNQMKFNK